MISCEVHTGLERDILHIDMCLQNEAKIQVKTSHQPGVAGRDVILPDLICSDTADESCMGTQACDKPDFA